MWRSDLRGCLAYDAHGEQLGSIEELFEDLAGTGATWALVSTDVFGAGEGRWVPLHGARETTGGIVVPFARDQVRRAPEVAAGGLSSADQARLSVYYGLAGSASQTG